MYTFDDKIIFQSTLPTRGSDQVCVRPHEKRAYFNPRSPRGGATLYDIAPEIDAVISIHAPTRGSDHTFLHREKNTVQFQSTLPTRGSDAAKAYLPRVGREFQSTLPTRGSDESKEKQWPELSDFNPRSPRGGATTSAARRRRRTKNFNPRSPRGGATAWRKNKTELQHISIHAPHEGERLIAKSTIRAKIQFQSTLPTRGSDHTAWRFGRHIRISIHAPHEGERPHLNLLYRSIYAISIHAPHEGERPTFFR